MIEEVHQENMGEKETKENEMSQMSSSRNV